MKRFARGQSLVELALILPFLLMITVGAMELGYYIYTYSELENATRRAAEWASTTPPWTTATCDDFNTPTCANPRDECAILIKKHAIDHVFLNDLKQSHLTISYPFSGTRDKGQQIQIDTDYYGQWLSPIGERLFGNQLHFRFTARRTILSTDEPPGLENGCHQPAH